MIRGGSISQRPLTFSDDGKLLLAPCGNSVRVHSTVTGELIATLQGHTADVTCVALDPHNGKQVRTRISKTP